MLKGLARFCCRHRWLTIVFWVLILVGTVFYSTQEGGTLSNDFNLPGTETQETFDLLNDRFPARAGDTGQIVFLAEDGIRAVQERMEAGFAAAQEAGGEHLLSIVSPYSPEGAARQVAQSGEFAGKIAYAELQFDRGAFELPEDLKNEIEEAVDEAVEPDETLTVEYGGPPFQELAPALGRNEMIGLGAAVLILLIAFGSLLAMFLPIFTALFSLGIAIPSLAILANYVAVPTFTPLVTAMIGLGVGIDYALFIVTRHRGNLRDGYDVETSIAKAIATAGRAVLFAGITVIISLLGMFFMGLDFAYGLALGAGTAVLLTMLASVTLLPALMGLVGRKIDRLSIYRTSKKAKPGRRGFWYGWSRMIQRHPIVAAVLCLAILGALAAPVFSIRLGNQDAGNGPNSLTTRRAYDLLADAFGPGSNGPFLVAASLDSPQQFSRLQGLIDQLSADEAVANVGPAIPNDPDNPSAALIQVVGKFAPQDIETDDMVHRLRAEVIEPFEAESEITLHSGGPAAIGVDLTDKLTERLPYFFGGVILLSFLLLMMAFRSILVPLKAAIMNVIAISAAFGVLVAVFQWGWGANLIDVDRTGPIAAFAPMLLFAILFGLSMDYEVFLLSRIKEEHDKSGNNAQAVADGLASTARVITAAALIMVTVFFSFVLGEEPNAKLVGLGLAVAVLLDATLVRMVLVPSTMELLGEANWYLPRWLDKILPNIHIESDPDDALPPVPAMPAPAQAPAAIQAAAASGADVAYAAPAGPGYATVQPSGGGSGAGRHFAYEQTQSFPHDPAAPTPPPAPAAAAPPSAPAPLVPPAPAVQSRLNELLGELPFKAGSGDIRTNLEEIALATYDHFNGGGGDHIDLERLTGYLALEQRFGRIGDSARPEHAAQLLVGSVAAKALAGGEADEDYARAAVRIVLEGIGNK